MAGMFGGQPKVIPEFTGLQVNTSVQVMPIPIIYGAPRININLIYYNGFQVKTVKSGGKGVLSGGKGGKQVEYFATILLAIGEGPIGATKIIFQDSSVFTPADYPTNGTFFFSGGPGQVPWDYIQGHWPGDARPYKNTAYYGFPNAQLDSSATVPQIDLVVEGHLAGSSPLNNSTVPVTTGQYDPNGNPISFIGNINLGSIDADPAQVIYDFLTNPTYGAGFPPQWIDGPSLFTSTNGYNPGVGDAAVSTFCQAVGLAWSVVVNNAEPANTIIERWTKNLNVAPVWTGSLLKFIPYWDAPASGNPGWDAGNVDSVPKKYFVPYYTAPAATITLDFILQSEQKDEDPITFTRKDPLEVYNTVRVDYKDRFNLYNDVPAEAKDEAHIELFGPRVDNIGLANEFSLGAYAQTSATMQLRRNVGIMRTFKWRMGPLWAWLNPMDIVTIPDPVNYNNTLTVRITSVEDDENENVTFIAEEYLPLVLSTTTAGGQSPTILPQAATNPPYQGALNNPPSPAFPPVIFEPTNTMLAALGVATPQFVFGASGGTNGVFDTNWGGVNIWISLDNVNYEQIGELIGPSIIGYLTAPLPAYAGPEPDPTDSLSVTLMISDGALSNSNPTAAAAGNSICIVSDDSGYEVLSYTTATLTAPFTYTLTGLYRNFYNTLPRAFAAGAKFMFVGTNANVFMGNLPAAYVGHNFFVKPQSFNVFLQSPEDLANVTAYEYIVNGGEAGSSILVTDTASSFDAFTIGGSYVMPPLTDVAASSDTYTPSVAFTQTLSDSPNSSDALTP